MIKNYSVLIKILLISIFFFLIFDATIGKYIYKKFIREQLQDINLNFQNLTNIMTISIQKILMQ